MCPESENRRAGTVLSKQEHEEIDEKESYSPPVSQTDRQDSVTVLAGRPRWDLGLKGQANHFPLPFPLYQVGLFHVYSVVLPGQLVSSGCFIYSFKSVMPVGLAQTCTGVGWAHVGLVLVSQHCPD